MEDEDKPTLKLELSPRQAKLLLRIMQEDDPNFDYSELGRLSSVLSDVRDLATHGEVRWQRAAKAKQWMEDALKGSAEATLKRAEMHKLHAALEAARMEVADYGEVEWQYTDSRNNRTWSIQDRQIEVIKQAFNDTVSGKDVPSKPLGGDDMGFKVSLPGMHDFRVYAGVVLTGFGTFEDHDDILRRVILCTEPQRLREEDEKK